MRAANKGCPPSIRNRASARMPAYLAGIKGEKRMRILHTGDWHLGRTLEGRSRLIEQEAFLDELVQIVKDQQVDLVLMAGDVYDSVNPPAAAEAMFYDAAARLTET